MKRLFLKMTAAAAVAALFGACGGTDDDDDVTAGNMIDVAFRSGEISALVTAARLVGLEDELKAPDANLTVLAPTNEAWALLSGQLGYTSIQEMLEDLPVATLEAILRYHILPTQLSKEDLFAGGPTQDTQLVQNGATVALPLNTANSELRVTDSVGRVALANVFDVPADNGVFHLLDRVLIPSGVLTVLQTVQSNPERFRLLTDAALGLPTPNAVREALTGTAVTLFAPVNAAFQAFATALPTATSEQVSTVLLYHTLDSVLVSSAFALGAPLATLAGQDITLNAGGTAALGTIDDTSATDANITQVDILATNGVVHVIDKVLLPAL
jgi:transforming growth factor-beta-induced protein